MFQKHFINLALTDLLEFWSSFLWKRKINFHTRKDIPCIIGYNIYNLWYKLFLTTHVSLSVLSNANEFISMIWTKFGYCKRFLCISPFYELSIAQTLTWWLWFHFSKFQYFDISKCLAILIFWIHFAMSTNMEIWIPLFLHTIKLHHCISEFEQIFRVSKMIC